MSSRLGWRRNTGADCGPGALARWNAEREAGQRQNTTADFDHVAAAACWEATGQDLAREGDTHRAAYYFDVTLLRLHGCYGMPDDGDKDHPGPGRRLLAQLKGDRKEPAAPARPAPVWAGVRPSRARTWGAA